jgi:hypothetical protein
MLVQALKSDDKALLEGVLGVGDERIVHNTVRRLPAAAILPFFNAVIVYASVVPVCARAV